ncbi:MAG TPA: hypothetical protein VLW85_06090 [Myxococcales bacterium]|nr:hypothetical protein [Myxococcales bacterium]
MRRLGWLLLTGLFACSTPPRPAPQALPPPPLPPMRAAVASLPPLPPQPGNVIADVEGVSVLALAAPQFAALGRDQRLLALSVSEALSAGDATAIDQGYRHNLRIARLLRGILSQAQVVPGALLPRLRDFARVVWLNHGIHDAVTGRKQLPDFTASELRLAALAAQAAGADLGLQGATLEYVLRGLEAPLFDPAVDAQRTSHQPDALLNSAVNFYAGLSQRDLQGFVEQRPRNSRLAREDGTLREQPYRLPRVADGLEASMAWSAPPQREVLDPLAAYFRGADPADFAAAERAWHDAAGPIDFFAGFLDTSADPRGRKGLFGGAVGIADAERGERVASLAAEPARLEALVLAGAAGALRPLPFFTVTAEKKSALFLAAQDAAARIGSDLAAGALAEPEFAAALSKCAPQLRAAHLAWRALALQAADGDGAARELAADAAAAVAPEPGPMLSDACRPQWARWLATTWLASAADLPDDGPVENDRQRAIGLCVWWFTGKGALAERRVKTRRFYGVPDSARFESAARELSQLLKDIARNQDSTRLRDLFLLHASKVDGPLRDDVRRRLKAAGAALRVAVIPPRLDPVLQDGKVVDAQAAQVTDLDAEVLRTWNQAL